MNNLAATAATNPLSSAISDHQTSGALTATLHQVTCTDGVPLAVFSYGDETLPPLVLVHGYPDQHQVWERVIAHLMTQFYVITYDVRGAGQSGQPAQLKGYRLSQLEADLQSVTSQLLGKHAYHLAGHDWGGIQCWEAVTDKNYAGRILSFSCLSGPCLDHVGHALRRLGRQSPAQAARLLGKSWYIGVFHVPFLAPLFWRHYSPHRWQRYLMQMQHCADIPQDDYLNRDGVNGIGLYRANMLPRLLQPRQRHAQCPVQAIVLERDRFVGKEYAQEMRHWVSDLTLTSIDSDHWALLSEPARIAEAIARFATVHQPQPCQNAQMTNPDQPG